VTQTHFTPVIHVSTDSQAERNLNVAMENGADGVFLINHHIYAASLAVIFRNLRVKYPDVWIGVNYLGLPPWPTAQLSVGSNGLWMDKCIGRASWPDNIQMPLYISTAFKYQVQYPLKDEAKRAAWIASSALPGVRDVVVTSGKATGSPPTVEKLQKLRKYLPDHLPLGIASGLTPENVGSFLPHATHFLVSTGIGLDFHDLDPAKVRAFAEAIK
jgi:hypothetical protein